MSMGEVHSFKRSSEQEGDPLEVLAEQVEAEIKTRIAGKTFTIYGAQITVPRDSKNPESALWDPDIPNALLVDTIPRNDESPELALWDSDIPDALLVDTIKDKPKLSYRIRIFFSEFLKSPEATTIMYAILQEKNIPASMRLKIIDKLTTGDQSDTQE